MEHKEDFAGKLWKAIDDDRTLMLGLDGFEDGHARPMTAQRHAHTGDTLWFFTSVDNTLVRSLGGGAGRAMAAFIAKGHDLFASITGDLREDTDPEMVNKLWNPFVAAWYEGGQEDPTLRLLRLDPERAEVWLNGSSLVAGMKMLLGMDPKRDYQDKVREIDFGGGRAH